MSRDVETIAEVERLVRRFYRAAISDSVLGPVFHDFGVPKRYCLARQRPTAPRDSAPIRPGPTRRFTGQGLRT